MSEKAKVMIHCLVYNHEPYLRDCLEGFVSQKTDFPFKAIVHDDCSTDGSAAIIREYAEKYPHIIEPIYETENQWRKGGGALDKVMYDAILGRSDYIAYCEGDDYWIDPMKLQKQVDFLDNNPDYAMCFSACKIQNDFNLRTSTSGESVTDRDYESSELLKTWCVPTASILIRSHIAKDERILKYDKRKTCGDIFIILTAADYGKVRGMKDKMTVYRLNPGSVMNRTYSEAAQKRAMLSFLGHYTFIKEKYPKVSRSLIRNLRFNTQSDILFSDLFSLKEKFGALYQSLTIHPLKAIKLCTKALYDKIKKK